ncbi:MAG TPA: phosphoribosylamine--glycine ligase [Chthonomonadaceae bacterium]|nr:phosphoribosylamine--glycine ligase [Chthonomonadaceae bacterium]
MRVLVIGGGGREHALVWKIAQSPQVEKIYCAPGNAGIAQLAECIPLKVSDIGGLADFAAQNAISLTVVGPEAPLIAGIVDAFEARGLPIFGPSAEPARIEGSKVFAKQLMQAAGIPTAAFWACASLPEARARVQEYYANRPADAKVVIKADGIAAGKGVIIAGGEAEANAALDRIMAERVFGASGDQVVIEECLVGEEASIMAITDGDTVVPLIPSQDHKRIYDNDLGPNTGGMGAYAPVPIISPDTVQLAVERILQPAVDAICEYGIPYRGVLYAGIMLTDEGPKCIEFNCRLGDPETQAILPLLESDLVPLLCSVLDGTLDKQEIHWKEAASVCVVAASEGYPDAFDPGKDVSGLLGRPIIGLEEATHSDGCLVFHAGTSVAHGQVVTSGGRVLAITGLGTDLQSAVVHAYHGLSHIHYEGMHYRRDIAARALRS